MLRLKSRTMAPPGGFLYTQKETGWRNWLVDPPSQWDFNRLCSALQEHRRANPHFRLQVNMGIIQNEVDIANATRVAAMPNTESYIITDTVHSFQPAPASPNRLQALAAAAKKVEAGAEVVLAWERSGERPVSQDIANARAQICSQCPKNGKGDFTRFFTVPTSELIRLQIQRLHDLKLATPYDEALGVCEACSCPLKLKVHTPFKFILPSITPEIEADLNPSAPKCWILTELPNDRTTQKSSEATL